MKTYSILQIGMGPLGQRVAGFVARRPGWRTLAAVDKDPALNGTTFPGGARIFPSVNDAISATGKPDAAVLTTVSDMPRITPQIEEILRHGIPIVSSCEELVYPWQTHPELSARIDAAAREAGVAVLGTGVNPGFLMDALPLALTAACESVSAVRVKRYQDAAHRRIPFQQKIGAGLDLDEFQTRVDAGKIRHVGLTESMHMIAARFGWKLDATEDRIEPVTALHARPGGAIPVAAGQAAGVRQVGKGWSNGDLKIELIFQASVGEEDSFDEVEIMGNPPLRSRIEGGVGGDTATCAILLNAIPRLIGGSPGLKTMIDIPMVTFPAL